MIKEKKERRNRSEKYQQIYFEVASSNEMLENFSNNDSISHKLNPWIYNDRLKELEDELKKEFWRVVDDLLTDRQREVIRLYSDGYTQMEIAKILGVNQSSITKSINGNVDYKNGKISYGGSLRKLNKIVEQDEKIKSILEEMRACREEKY